MGKPARLRIKNVGNLTSLGNDNSWISCFPASIPNCPETDSKDGPARCSSQVSLIPSPDQFSNSFPHTCLHYFPALLSFPLFLSPGFSPPSKYWPTSFTSGSVSQGTQAQRQPNTASTIISSRSKNIVQKYKT